MTSYQIHVFISHSWAYSSHYETLASWIFGREWKVGRSRLVLRNYSVPHYDAIMGTRSDRGLRVAIDRQISRSHVIVVPTGLYSNHSRWIGNEIERAQHFAKPILAVDLRGSLRTSAFVGEAADLRVRWSSASVINGIWDLYSK